MSALLLLARGRAGVARSVTSRMRVLAELCASPLPKPATDVKTLSARVEAHVTSMGASWK